jgi:uncharacterized protein (TIGR02246 family)
MTPSSTTRAQVLATLDALNTRVRARDVEGALALFVPEAEALLVGSSAGEVARGSEAIRALFERVFSAPYTVGWEWDEPRVAASGDVAWLFAEGALVLRRPEGETRRPYRLSAVFVRRAQGWRWAQFHGAEPAPE